MTQQNPTNPNHTKTQLLYTLGRRTGKVTNIVWAQDGKTVASAIDRSNVRVWDTETGQMRRSFEVNLYTVKSIALSPDGQMIVAGTYDKTVQVWDVATGRLKQTLKTTDVEEGELDWISSAEWSPDGSLLAATTYYLRTILIWDIETGKLLYSLQTDGAVSGVVWSPKGNLIASKSNPVQAWETENGQVRHTLMSSPGSINSVAWSPDGQLLAIGKNKNIEVWSTRYNQLLRILEGHSEQVASLIWSPDTHLLASAANDGRIFLWRCDTWEMIEGLKETISDYHAFSIFFHPSPQPQSIFGHEEIVIRNWEINTGSILDMSASISSVNYMNAKIVLVGESNVGKSCLALRLTQNRYEEQGTTHGMHIWTMSPEKLSLDAIAPAGEKRDVVLWDMGGQDEYRLVHQLFFHDTTLALVLLDPTRGRTAFEEVEGWNRRLEKQLHERKAIKLLVGTKLDELGNNEEDTDIIDKGRLNKLVKDCGFAGYFPTSAKTGRGIAELRKAVSRAIDWDTLAKTSRPILFQVIREEIERRQKDGEVILLNSELEQHVIKSHSAEFDRMAINTVIEQLALQGIITDTRLASGERVLVLQIAEIERYAGSLIIAAKNNPHGIPAIEERMIASATISFPGMKKSERLSLFHERVVLECVVQLLLEHGICMKHEGLLIFPSLFQAEESTDSVLIHHSISLYYDFSGAIENIYSSLVVKLAISQQFGRVRLWEDCAEFGFPDQGICGIRKVGHRSGLAHLDLFFSDQVQSETRGLFTVFIEEHLRKEGVNITEVLEVTCGKCGHQFQELILRRRLVEGYLDIICPVCETRSPINEGAKKLRTGNVEIEKSLIALKTTIERRNKEAVIATQSMFKEAQHTKNESDPIRILHLSDLHLKPNESVESLIEPLIRDLEDTQEGLGVKKLDYLLISGDLTNRATLDEFNSAYEFISEIIARFKLTAERCIIVPGNHDLSWDRIVYDWRQSRLVNKKQLQEGCYVEQGNGFLVRNETEYPRRFQNFANFYHSLTQQQYPLLPEDQCIPVLFDNTQIQFLSLNSSWEIDEFFLTRSNINVAALSKGLLKADEQVKIAREDGRIGENASILRLAVCHHPVTGNEKIINDAFLSRLQHSDIRVCLHGHVHEERTDVIFNYHPTRRIYSIGAGSFGAPAKARPESTPRLYNILEIARDYSGIRVHTRSMRKDGGSWGGWPAWPTQNPTQFATYYDIALTT